MTKKDIAEKIGITEQTLHNWKKNKKLLYEIVINYFSNENNLNISKEEKDLLEAFRELSEEEKKLYSYEIKARALRKKLG